MKVAVGLPPAAALAELIAGKRMEIICMLPPGRTPHDFAPRTDTVRKSAGAALFLSTGMPFENKIAEFMKGKAAVCDISRRIKRIEFSDGDVHHHHHDDGDHDEDHDHHGHHHEGSDPHIWLSPKNAVIMAENICADLTAADPAGAEYYRKNLETLRERLLDIDRRIAGMLAPYKGRVFFVYHPAFGYFAEAYGLRQRAIELNGREATPVQLAQVIKDAKTENVSTIFVQEQFNPGSAKALAGEIGGSVAPLDPLAKNLPENLEKIATALLDGFRKEKK